MERGYGGAGGTKKYNPSNMSQGRSRKPHPGNPNSNISSNFSERNNQSAMLENEALLGNKALINGKKNSGENNPTNWDRDKQVLL